MLRLIPLATYIYTILVFVVSLAKLVIPFIKGNVENGDKFAHAFAYFVFTAIWTLFFYTFKSSKEPKSKDFKKAAFKAAIFGILFGVVMEFFQLLFTNYRSFEIADAMANSIGSLIACIILYFFANFFSRVKKRA